MENSRIMKTILLLAIVVSTTALDLPSGFTTCERSDPKVFECLAKASKEAIMLLANGNKDFEILPLDPLEINSIKIGSLNSFPKQEYWNIKVLGLPKGEIIKYRIDWDKLILYVEGFNNRIDFIADYKLSGRILILPIQGEGKCNVSLSNVTTTHQIRFEKFEKDGEVYLRAKKYIIKLFQKHTYLRFDNLFNGDTFLSEQMQKFFNENSELLAEEVKGYFINPIEVIFCEITNKIFTRVPMNKIFK